VPGQTDPLKAPWKKGMPAGFGEMAVSIDGTIVLGAKTAAKLKPTAAQIAMDPTLERKFDLQKRGKKEKSFAAKNKRQIVKTEEAIR
jgi:hypothetical protein